MSFKDLVPARSAGTPWANAICIGNMHVRDTSIGGGSRASGRELVPLATNPPKAIDSGASAHNHRMPPHRGQRRRSAFPALHALGAVWLAVAMLTGTACTNQPTYDAAATQTFADVDAAYARGDYATALQLNLPLANGGNAVAQFNLGLMYDKGNGVAQDYAEAAKWFRKAADQGLAVAQFNLGVSFEKGQGLRQDWAEAAKWYRMAADQDLAMAEYNLGILYAQGKGVPQDYVEAYKWLSLAASPFLAAEKSIRAMAGKSRDMVATHMTPAQVAEAQKLAREWKPK